MEMKMITIGHASYDITFPVETFPKENTKTRLTKHIDCGGGPASNAAYLLALWHQSVSFAGVVGKDFYGKIIQKELETVGVDTTYLECYEDAQTMLSFIMANTSNGSRTILTAQQEYKRQLKQIPQEEYDVILVDGEEPSVSAKVLQNNPQAIKVIDAGSVKEGTLVLCPLVDYLVCSKNFAEESTGITYDGTIESLITMHTILTEKYQNIVVITLEAAGCFTKIDQTYKIIPSISVKAVDTTGAGDIFHGAFTYFISHNYSLEETCRLANIAGALSTLKIGGRYSMPTLDEVINYVDVLR